MVKTKGGREQVEVQVLWLATASSRSAVHRGHGEHDDSNYGLTLTRAVKLVVRGGRAE